MNTTAAPTLALGETHIATINIPEQQAYQLTLLPGEVEDVTHEAATEWAASIGGVLPNRVEQSLLFAHHRDQFQPDWYWSAQLHESDPDYAWSQLFLHGFQLNDRRSLKLRARAVRRLPI